MQIRKQYVLAVLLGMSIGVALYAISLARAKSVKQDPPSKKELITSVPEVFSCVKSIRVINKAIRNAGTSDAIVEVEVENTGELGIIAISLESHKGRETYSEIRNTFEADETLAIIEPHKTATLTMPVANVYIHVPLQIGSVVYVDGTDEGCRSSLKRMRDTKVSHEAEKAKRKGSPQ